MSDNSALNEMGVKNPDEITHYTLRQEGHGDTLKIYYRRKKGSFLPTSRKYKFGRSAKTIRVDSGKKQYEEIYEISPFLLRAVSELDAIVDDHQSETDHKEKLLKEIEYLEKTMASRLSYLREQVHKL